MAEPDDKDLTAAERALGTEARAEETAAERRAREGWDARLAPLALAAPPAEPPADMFQRITAALDAAPDAARIVQLAERRARRWRAVATATSGIAACLMVIVAAGLILLSDAFRGLNVDSRLPMNYVALVTPEGGGGPAMIVEIDAAKGIATVRALRVEAPEGRSLELWQVAEGAGPVSLGLIDPGNPLLHFAVETTPGDTIAVSVEPPGGSPTGAPTGPVILSGPLIEAR